MNSSYNIIFMSLLHRSSFAKLLELRCCEVATMVALPWPMSASTSQPKISQFWLAAKMTRCQRESKLLGKWWWILTKPGYPLSLRVPQSVIPRQRHVAVRLFGHWDLERASRKPTAIEAQGIHSAQSRDFEVSMKCKTASPILILFSTVSWDFLRLRCFSKLFKPHPRRFSGFPPSQAKVYPGFDGLLDQDCSQEAGRWHMATRFSKVFGGYSSTNYQLGMFWALCTTQTAQHCGALCPVLG